MVLSRYRILSEPQKGNLTRVSDLLQLRLKLKFSKNPHIILTSKVVFVVIL
jgi:hypothetical protein